MKDQPDTPLELRARALRLLARREHSRTELERKLQPHAESSAALQALCSRLKEKNQLSEERFAEERARQLSRKYGAARIRQDLKARGIADDIAERSCQGLNDLEKAKEILQRKYRVPASTREEKAKRMRFLQSRGFASEIIFKLLSARGDD